MNEDSDIQRLQEELRSELLSAGADLVGLADISDAAIPDKKELCTAISIGIAYAPEIVDVLDTDPEAFENHLADNKQTMEQLLSACETLMGDSGFAAWTPPISKNLPGLLSDFSHKTAATKAGLGWVGKSALFVSSEFGPGVRLATVLTVAPLAPGTPVVESRCGRCVECIEACPYGAIRGAQWHAGIPRDELLDAFLCSKEREAYIAKLGFKHPCGLCIRACPFGKKHNREPAKATGGR
jgi:epoxyqueuosine reductase QueG